jgi:hypothetical protein
MTSIEEDPSSFFTHEDKVKHMDTLTPTVAEILRLQKQILKKIRSLNNYRMGLRIMLLT